MEGEGLDVNDISVYQGTQNGEGGRGGISRSHFARAFFVLNKEWYIFLFYEHSKLQRLKEKVQATPQALSFYQGPLPPLST